MIADITISTATTQVDIDLTSTPIEKGELYELEMSMINNGANGVVSLMFNDNTTLTNYYFQQLVAFGTSTSGFRGNNNAIMSFNTGLNSMCKVYIKLSNDGKGISISNNLSRYGSSTPELWNYVNTSTFTMTSITKLNIVSADVGAIGVNSRIQLRKVATKVDEIIVSTATTQIDFTTDIGKGNEYLLVSDILGNSDYYLYANDDTSGYNTQRLLASSTTVTGARTTNALFTKSTTKALSVTNVKLPNSGLFNYQSNAIKEYGGSGVELYKYYGSEDTAKTSITKLSIVSASANQLGIGTRVEVYKMV